ncbi:hypothetical protein T492DRAFT_1074287 [Pavlovales sp. CCMP2436]|nr:hypothetical protein T492DRAFT_1074287 [Pavlovales sp. CCMP2436]
MFSFLFLFLFSVSLLSSLSLSLSFMYIFLWLLTCCWSCTLSSTHGAGAATACNPMIILPLATVGLTQVNKPRERSQLNSDVIFPERSG